MINAKGIVQARSGNGMKGVVVVSGGEQGVVQVSGGLDMTRQVGGKGFQATGAQITFGADARLPASGVGGGTVSLEAESDEFGGNTLLKSSATVTITVNGLLSVNVANASIIAGEYALRSHNLRRFTATAE